MVPGTDAAQAALVPVSDALEEELELAFDHERILRDAVARVRVDLELRGIATAFVGPTFTLAELRSVYEAVWACSSTARTSGEASSRNAAGSVRPGAGPAPERAAEASGALPRGSAVAAGRAHPPPAATRKAREPMRAVVYDRTGRRRCCGSRRSRRRYRAGRGARPRARLHRDPHRLGYRAADPFFSRFFTGLRAAAAGIVGMELAGMVEAVGGAVTEFAVGDRVFGSAGGRECGARLRARQGALAHMPAGLSFEEAAALSDGPSIAKACLRRPTCARPERPGLRRVRGRSERRPSSSRRPRARG